MSTEPRDWTEEFDDDRFDRVIEVILVGLLAFMPFAFGAVEAWSEEIVIVLAAGLSICFCAKVLVRGRRAVAWMWAFLPIGLFLAAGVIQLIPLPIAFVRLFSPGTVPQKMELLNDLLATGLQPTKITISFYPYATRHDLRLVLAVSSVFVVVLSVFRRPRQITRLLLAVTVIGAGVALVALAQDILGNDKIYWCIASPHRTAHSGPFVNHSHYAQFMNLSMGAALALGCVTLHETFRHQRLTPAAVAEYLGSDEGRRIWGLAAMIALGTATIFASLSRGGMVSLMIAGAFTVLVLTATRALRGTGWVMALLALGAFLCVLYLGFDAVYERLGTLRDINRAEGGRWQIVKDVAVAWTKFPVVGAGLGTHEVVYPMFDRSTASAIASHAENEYAQAAEETGLIGLAALVAFAVFVGRSYAQAIRKARVPIHSAAYGLGFGLIAILVHSLSDFGQHLPANAVLSAVFCALMIRLPRVGLDTQCLADRASDVPTRMRIYESAALVVVCVISGWAVLGADGARRGAAHWTRALAAERDLAARQWQGSDAEYKELLEYASKARECQMENVNYGHWLNTYRWHAISRVTDPNTGTLFQSPEIADWIERITVDLKQTLVSCPTFGPAWCVLGQLERLLPGREEEAVRHVTRGYRLAPCHPTVCFVAGLFHMDRGDQEAAFADWDRAVKLDDSLFPEVAARFITASAQPDLALRIAGDRIDRLAVVAGLLETSSGKESAGGIWSEVVRLLEQKCREPDAPAPAFARLASVCRKDGRIAEAIEYYRQALVLDYGEVDWRLNLALLLAESGDVREAIREARVCLRFRPEYAAAKRLIARLSLDPRAAEPSPQSP
jgi:O-antigen ligase/tetratricopeptide (TPR) repeat protein